jgi:hypothetical protein
MQPDDYADIVKWLGNSFNDKLIYKILSITGYQCLPKDIQCIIYNIAYAALMCRIHYHRYPEPLPSANDASGFANYHKKYYNGGSLGKANVDKNTAIFQQIIHGEL